MAKSKKSRKVPDVKKQAAHDVEPKPVFVGNCGWVVSQLYCDALV
jgi:hypothetical protein